MNIHFFILLIIGCIVSFADILIYCFKLSYALSIAVSTILALILVFLTRKKLKLKTDFELLDLVFVGLFLTKFLAKFMSADNEYDTCSYHIYLQETPFIDKINFDFFVGRAVNSFLYPLRRQNALFSKNDFRL